MARLCQTLGGRSGGPLIHSSYTTRRDTTLESGHFVWPMTETGRVSLTPAQLSMLLEGILGAEPGGALRLSEADIEALFAA